MVIGFANSHSVVTDTVPQLKASIAIAVGAKVLVTRIAAVFWCFRTIFLRWPDRAWCGTCEARR